MTMMTDEELRKVPKERLYRYFRNLRGYYQSFFCYEDYIGYHDETDWVEKLGEYVERVRKILQEGPYQCFSKGAKKRARKEMLANLRGNRYRPRNRHHHKAAPLK